ncbi:MAG: alpha/beta-type small acid-soluble spore protein [Clostridiales bacterium]
MAKSNPIKKSAQGALNRFKMEVATELGIQDYENMDKGNLSSRENGYVGGNMTKKMVAYAEEAMSQGQNSAINSAAQIQKPQN